MRLTVKKLRKCLEGLPDDTPVMYQRIEDMYFEKYHWSTIELPWEGNEMTSYIYASGLQIAENPISECDKFLCIYAHY